ncbi:MAG: HAD family hydrolase, partial [Actinomycetota bacterium]
GGGIRTTPEEVEAAFAAVAPSFIEVMDKLGVTNWSTSRDASRRFWHEVYATAFAQMEIEDPGGRLSDALYERFTRYESYRLFPDAVPVLEGLKRSGLTVGLISNFEEWLEGMLIEMEVAHLFDLMVISGKEGVEKPDPAIFHLAIDRSGMDPEHSVYVGDHPKNDMEAAEAVGMKAILIDRRDRYPEFSGPRIRSLEELPGRLAL